MWFRFVQQMTMFPSRLLYCRTCQTMNKTRALHIGYWRKTINRIVKEDDELDNKGFRFVQTFTDFCAPICLFLFRLHIVLHNSLLTFRKSHIFFSFLISLYLLFPTTAECHTALKLYIHKSNYTAYKTEKEASAKWKASALPIHHHINNIDIYTE